MKKEIIQKLHSSFEDAAHEQDGVEFWLARDLQVLLGYNEWRNFTKVIEKAQEACKNSLVAVEDQFVEVNKLITHGKGGQRAVADFMLTRYACYLIAQNGDPAKEPIAFAPRLAFPQATPREKNTFFAYRNAIEPLLAMCSQSLTDTRCKSMMDYLIKCKIIIETFQRHRDFYTSQFSQLLQDMQEQKLKLNACISELEKLEK